MQLFFTKDITFPTYSSDTTPFVKWLGTCEWTFTNIYAQNIMKSSAAEMITQVTETGIVPVVADSSLI